MTRCKYLELMMEQIRCKRVREVIAEELNVHMDEQKMDFMAEGMTEKEAEEAAVREMGDPVEVGVEMDRIHRPKMPWGMIVWIVGLSVAGFVFSTMLLYGGNEAGYFTLNMVVKNGCILAVSIGVMIGVCLIDYSRIAHYAELIMAIYLTGIMLGVTFTGGMMNGRNGWINIPLLGFVNVSMLLCLCVPLYGAILYKYRGEGYRGMGKCVFWSVFPVVIAYTRPDMVTAALLMSVFVIMLSVAVSRQWFKVARKKVLALMWAVVLLLPSGFLLYLLNTGRTYQVQRVRAILGMFGEEMPYITKMVQNLAAQSILLGEGAGKQQLSRLPDIGSYVLTGIAVSYGILAAAMLAAAIGLLFFWFFKKSLKQRNQLGMMMGIGCSVLLTLQFVMYLAVNVVGIPMSAYCPFLTFGGGGRIIMFVLLGLLLSIFRYEHIITESFCAPKKGRLRIRIVRE